MYITSCTNKNILNTRAVDIVDVAPMKIYIEYKYIFNAKTFDVDVDVDNHYENNEGIVPLKIYYG